MTTKDEKDKTIHGVPACLNEGDAESGLYGATCSAWVKTKDLEKKDEIAETAVKQKKTIHAVASGPAMKMHRKIDFKEIRTKEDEDQDRGADQ